MFRDAKKNILFSAEGETEEHLEILNEVKDKLKIIKLSNQGLRMCTVDEDNTIIFPISEKGVHPDYDLCIWIRNKHTTKFLKHLLTSA